MYRIMFSRSGYYYVQSRNCWNVWKRCSGFFITKAGARDFVARCRGHYPDLSPRVVEYL